MLTRQRLAAGLIIGTAAVVAACSTSGPGSVVVDDDPKVAEGYRLERVVAGTALHSINGITIRPDGTLVATSLAGEMITEIDPSTGAFTPLVGSPDGRSDDAVVTPTGELIWTDPAGGVVRRRETDGTVSTIVDNLPGANSIAYDRARARLFDGQTYLGSGLWEIDPTGASPKRLIAEDAGKPNAFAFGPDGKIYAPLSASKTVARIDPETGAATPVVSGFRQPVSVRFDSEDRLYVLDGATGELVRVDPVTGRKRAVTSVPAAADNMVIGPNDHAYISNMADSSVIDVDLDTGAQQVITRSQLAFPTDVAAGPDGVLVADATAVRVVDTSTGQVRELVRRLSSELQFPTGISVHGDHLVATSALIGSIQVLDRTGHPLRQVAGFQQPGHAIELDDGALIVTEPSNGRLLRVDGAAAPRPIAEGLGTPTGLAVAGDGRLLVTDASEGRLLAIDPEAGGVTVVGTDLGAPRRVAIAPDGAAVVLDARGRVLRLEPGSTMPIVLVEGLAVGHLDAPHPRSGGLTVTPDGAVYIAADKEASVYALRRV